MLIAQSEFVKSVDFAFFFIIAISVFFLVLITGLMIYFVFKYSRKKHPKAENIHGNVPLEILWTVIPTILVLFMFYFGWMGYKEMSKIPEDSMVVTVTAQMWKWSFKYENGRISDTLYVPVNRPVKVILNSLDVNHSFYIPAFRVKKDVIPGKQNTSWFKATEVGSYPIFCAEYCGLNHSYMYNEVVVMPENNFITWLTTDVGQVNNFTNQK
ncbi:MAG: cytochrome c oxidase subunit II [Ignavibacteria bacterium RIFOXYB2_FULL_35_12]|nr:MAG: cytochrome c oxidase subunit II [Ignavibacteria bacterium GWC2_35_8]OGU59348.1 MAG: cytochrome c oxidase subunit II [Ignavibacteria bacterium GWF2_35_20]OGU86459.1 MAG: cytochrome c oxidase subunit II [Ignavibacteria bacterium RIFOXYA12_FULL_35_25]OGU92338.1 MAG: cytochrome c oxidase subunit II [Ignavibacteria bacterium RIFOXYC12_FULL_35_11]OGU97708.1 MAG: cytochrome c oxidase subunit II [Ignavibacteria bacterium RIFOXYB12_FULL_35_14]OGU98927.1 MAG: cytochrome c oxidase subunit II [Ign